MSRFMSLGITLAFASITFLAFQTALAPTAAAQAREEPTDPPSIEIAARATSAGAPGRARVTLMITAREPVPNAVLDIVSAGTVRLESPPAFKTLAPGEPYHPGMSHNQRFNRALGRLQSGVPVTVRLIVTVADDGRGFVAARVSSTTNPYLDESLNLYIGMIGTRIFSNTASLLDVDADMLRARANANGIIGATLQRQLKELYESGASSRSTRSKGASEQPLLSGRILITGRLLFTDRAGGTHPVRAVTVQVYDSDPSTEVLLDSVLTDDDGRFRATVPNADGDGTGQDVFIRAHSAGPNVRVREWAANTVHSIRSEDVMRDVRDGETIDIQLTAANNQKNNVAFEIHQANEQMARYIAQLQRQAPPQLTVRYPKKGDSSRYSGTMGPNGTMLLADTDAHDWDNIQHEYGHHVQRHSRIGDNPGGGHGSGEDLCTRYNNKTKGINLAYGETWPTVFSLISQHEQGLAGMGIPHLGDTRYTDVKGEGYASGYDLETGAAANGGDGRELSMMRVMWDFYDPVDRTDVVELEDAALWAASVEGGRHPFSAFWTALTRLRPEAERMALGAVMASQRLGTTPTTPADGTTYSGGTAPTFRWDASSACRNTSGLRYSFIIVDKASGQVRLRSLWQTARTFTPNASQRTEMFDGADGPLIWAVVTRDENAPQTGDYYGTRRIMIDDSQP